MTTDQRKLVPTLLLCLAIGLLHGTTPALANDFSDTRQKSEGSISEASSKAKSWKFSCPFKRKAKTELAQPEQASRPEPLVQLDVAIESPHGILSPGAYFFHPLMSENGFSELTLSQDNKVVTRFALSPAQSEPSPIASESGFPVIRLEAKLTADQKAVIFTVFEGPDRYVSKPFPVVPE